MKIFGREFTFNGKKVYHEGDKPTPEDIGAAKSSHNHTKAQITDFPVSLPANGGNANTANYLNVVSGNECVLGNGNTQSVLYINYRGSSNDNGITQYRLCNGKGGTLSELVANVFTGTLNGNAGSADSVPWSGVIGKPSSLPASDVPAWAKASTKPSYAWSEIGSKPTTFTPASHTHDDRYYTESEVDTKITGASGNTVTVSTTAPANPRKGDIWI